MTQKITVDCSTCETRDTFESERCITIVWQHDRIGIITHEIDDKDIVDALRKLSRRITDHMPRCQN